MAGQDRRENATEVATLQGCDRCDRPHLVEHDLDVLLCKLQRAIDRC